MDSPCRPASASCHGTAGGRVQVPAFLLVALRNLCAVECRHYLVGGRSHRGGRCLCHPRKCAPDERCLRQFPLGQAQGGRCAPVHLPGCGLAGLGAVLSYIGPDFLALAGAGQCLCREYRPGAVVFRAGHTGRVALGVGVQPFPLRDHGGPLRRPRRRLERESACRRPCRRRRCGFRADGLVGLPLLRGGGDAASGGHRPAQSGPLREIRIPDAGGAGPAFPLAAGKGPLALGQQRGPGAGPRDLHAAAFHRRCPREPYLSAVPGLPAAASIGPYPFWRVFLRPYALVRGPQSLLLRPGRPARRPAPVVYRAQFRRPHGHQRALFHLPQVQAGGGRGTHSLSPRVHAP